MKIVRDWPVLLVLAWTLITSAALLLIVYEFLVEVWVRASVVLLYYLRCFRAAASQFTHNALHMEYCFQAWSCPCSARSSYCWMSIVSLFFGDWIDEMTSSLRPQSIPILNPHDWSLMHWHILAAKAARVDLFPAWSAIRSPVTIWVRIIQHWSAVTSLDCNGLWLDRMGGDVSWNCRARCSTTSGRRQILQTLVPRRSGERMPESQVTVKIWPMCAAHTKASVVSLLLFCLLLTTELESSYCMPKPGAVWI